MNKEDYRLKKMAGLVRGRTKVLDLGWVDQPNLFLLNKEVVGLDISSRSLPHNYTSSVIGDALDLPEPFKPGSFEAIVAGELIEHLERPLDFLRSCHKTLAHGGILVLSTPNPNSFIEQALTLTLSRRFFYSADHVMLFPQRWLVRMMEIAGFVDVRLYSGGFPVPYLGLVPFFRPWCYQTIAAGKRS